MAKRTKRRRRTGKDIQEIRDAFVGGVQSEGLITLTDLIDRYGSGFGLKNTPSDKNLVKRQLDHLARQGFIDVKREGRNLMVRPKGQKAASPARAAAVRPGRPRRPGRPAAPPVSAPVSSQPAEAELAVIRVYARQLEEFARTLQDQIGTLVRMVEKAAQ